MREEEFFYRLTPQIILDAVEREGFITTGLCWKLNSFENRVYDLELEDRSHIIVKFYRPGRWSKEQLQEEHEFLFDLQELEIPVCAPVRFKDGSSLKIIEGIYYTVWPRTGGRCLDEFSVEQMEKLGRLLGRIHAAGKKKPAAARLKLTSDNLGRAPLKFLLENNFLPLAYENTFSQVVENICNIFDELVIDVPYHRIHGDCHIGNLLFKDNNFYFLDFDDFYMGPAVQDFWMLLNNNYAVDKNNLSALLTGYGMFSDFKEKWLDLIEPLRALRFVHYAGWIAKRWEDPAFKDAFPHFGTEEYWQQELKDLQDQQRNIEKSSYLIHNTEQSAVNNSTDEAELTNKDFFWDWEE